MTIFSSLIAGFVAVVLGFIFHICMWRVCSPHAPIRWLLLIFAITGLLVQFSAAALAYSAGHGWPGYRIAIGWSFGFWLFVGSSTIAYVCFYSAIDVYSPLLTVIRFLHETPSGSISKGELRSKFETFGFVDSHLRHLGADGLTSLKNGKFVITPQGVVLLRILDIYHNIVGRKKDHR